MAQYRYEIRGVLFGAEGNLITRADFAEQEITDGIVEFAGEPVPVVFGTRYVDPVVTGWEGLSDFITKYWFPGIDQVSNTPQHDTLANARLEVTMSVLTMRWVLCLGAIDSISQIQMQNLRVNWVNQRLPATYEPADKALYDKAIEWQSAGALRLMVNASDADLFGGGQSGGVGYPYGREVYSSRTQLSEMWVMVGGSARPDPADPSKLLTLPNEPVIDHDTSAPAVTSMFFNNFNFGGRRPIPKTRVGVQRIGRLTERLADGTFKPQWHINDEPDLATISVLRPPNLNPYYLIVLDQTLEKGQRELIRSYLLELPYDEEGTQYQFIMLGYFEVGGIAKTSNVAEDVLSERGDREQTMKNLLKDRLDQYVDDAVDDSIRDRCTNFSAVEAQLIAQTYATHVYSVYSRRTSETGVICTFISDLYSADSVGWFKSQFGITRWTNGLQYPNEIMVDEMSSTPQFNELQKQGLIRFQPEMHLTLIRYLDGQSYSGVSTRYASAVPDADLYNRLYGFDNSGRISVIAGSSTSRQNQDTPYRWVNRFAFALPFGYSINPIHAMREAYINPDWGEAIPEESINESDFLAAARVCKEEGLDYCYVHKELGGVDQLVTGITDYIDGVSYYDHYTDSVRLRLIREDYDITNLPVYNEGNIAEVTNYRRQNSNHLVNSVTVRFHNASLGSDETVTVHDLDASFRAGGTVSATFNYDGCATHGAALKTAERELVALSRSIISFTLRIEEGDSPLGLGDPIVVTYRDLGIEKVVMRVTRIGYGDGTTGGITVDLIQDVFADLTLFGQLIDIEPYSSISAAPPFARLDLEVKFLESSYWDIIGIRNPFNNPHARYLKAGHRYDENLDDDAYITIDGNVVSPNIGRLLTDVQPLTSDPNNQGLTLQVQIKPEPVGDLLRIGNEIMHINNRRQTADDVWDVHVDKRAQLDTVATYGVIGHGADVWFLDGAWIDGAAWDGSRIHTLFQSGVHTDTELLLPEIDFIGRGNLSQPPEYVTVNNQFGDVSVDGAFTVRWKARDHRPADGQTIEIELRDTATNRQIFKQSTAVTRTFGQIDEQSAIISLAELNTGVPSGAGILRLTVGSLWSGRSSWQSWVTAIDWSATARNRCGWGYAYGSDWSGADCGGYGRQWDQDFGD